MGLTGSTLRRWRSNRSGYSVHGGVSCSIGVVVGVVVGAGCPVVAGGMGVGVGTVRVVDVFCGRLVAVVVVIT
jgi:hypothetical protein